MRISTRIHKKRPTICLDYEGFSYSVIDFLYSLSQSRHYLAPITGRILEEIDLNPQNFLLGRNSIEHLKEVNNLIQTFIINGDPGLIKDSMINDKSSYLPPISKPPLMFGLAGNCAQTWRGTNTKIPNYPVGYTRPWRSLSGHKSKVLLNNNVTSFRCANELGVVIGKEAFKVSKDEAYKYIFGYTVVNDMISNYWKDFAVNSNPNKKPNFEELLITSYYGRGTDTFGPVGPYIVTKEEVGDPYNLIMYTRQNGVQRDRSYSNAMIVGIEQAIEYLSSFMPLYPGTIVHMGTMGVDGITLSENEELGSGDYVEMEIEKVGVLRTYFEDRREF